MLSNISGTKLSVTENTPKYFFHSISFSLINLFACYYHTIVIVGLVILFVRVHKQKRMVVLRFFQDELLICCILLSFELGFVIGVIVKVLRTRR